LLEDCLEQCGHFRYHSNRACSGKFLAPNTMRNRREELSDKRSVYAFVSRDILFVVFLPT